MLYVVKFCGSNNNWFGFIKPYYSVRDIKTYSLTYCPTSMINGIANSMGIHKCEIARHKLQFNTDGMQIRMIVFESHAKKDKTGISYIYQLVNPVLYLAFKTKKSAEIAVNSSFYFGRKEYLLGPDCSFASDTDNIKQMSEEEFTEMKGVETFPCSSNDEDAVDCGFNHFDFCRPMFVKIDRKDGWDEDVIQTYDE